MALNTRLDTMTGAHTRMQGKKQLTILVNGVMEVGGLARGHCGAAPIHAWPHYLSRAKHKTALKEKKKREAVLCAAAMSRAMAGLDLECVHSRACDFVPEESIWVYYKNEQTPQPDNH